MKEIDFQDLLIDAWNKFKERWKPLCMASLIGYFIPLAAFMVWYMILIFGLVAAKQYGSEPDPATLIPLAIASPILFILIFFFTYGTENYCMKICRGENPENKDFLLPTKTYLRIIVANFLVTLIVCVGLIVCVVPGLILGFFFSLVSYAVIDHPELGIIDCLKLSWRLVKQNWKPILILDIIVYALQSVLGSTIIGLIPVLPFSILVASLLYTKFNDAPAEQPQNEPKVIPPTYHA